ncbi:MAG: cupin domain-containing protein [Candidatus Natronoplasma sp.]
METINLNDIETNKDKFSPKRLIQQDEVQVVLLAFAPEQGLKIHTTPVDVFFYVVEGTAEIQVGDEVEEVSQGNIVLSPKGIPHNVRNTSDGDSKILVVKTPNPKRK